MASLSDVAGIIDMDGFSIEKEFYCKELGMIKVGTWRRDRIFLIWEYAGVIYVQRTESRVGMSCETFTSCRSACLMVLKRVKLLS